MAMQSWTGRSFSCASLWNKEELVGTCVCLCRTMRFQASFALSTQSCWLEALVADSGQFEATLRSELDTLLELNA